MARQLSEAIGFARQSADDPNVLEGVAVEYGAISRPTQMVAGSGEVIREAWAPGAFSEDIAAWASRQDGRRAPHRPRHGERPVGTTVFADDGKRVTFRTTLFNTKAAQEYRDEVAAGLNGVSLEGMWSEAPRKMRDGTLLHRKGKLHGIAGSDAPAFDTAHIALRDMEEVMAEKETQPAPEPEPTPNPEPPKAERDAASQAVQPMPIAERSAAERSDAIVQSVSRTPAVVTRAEAVYADRGASSFILDGYRAQMQGDSIAAERQARHYAQLTDVSLQVERAGEVLSTEIAGAYPNDYMPGLITTRIIKGRPMGSFYNRIPITDATPKIFPKVTTSTTVAVQSAEGTNPAASDFGTTATTVTPLLYGAETVVSRQVLDGASPAALDMIYQDMLEAYAQASETVIKTAVEAGATASGTAITLATPYAGILGNLIAYQQARFSAPTGQFIPAALYTTLLTQNDTTGRPLLPLNGGTNTNGELTGLAASNLVNVQQYLSWASTANVVVTGRPADYVIFESSIARFSYDAVTGPAAVRIGIWAYLVVGVRNGSLKVTAA